MLTITWNYNRDPHQNCFAVATNMPSAWRLYSTLHGCMGDDSGDICRITVRNVEGTVIPGLYDEMAAWFSTTHKDDWM